MLAVEDDPGAGLALAVQDVLQQVAPGALAVLGGPGDQLPGARGDERVGVDLAVRVAERDSYLLAAVLEHVDVLDVGQPAQLPGPVAPDLDQIADVVDGLLSQRRVVVGRVADDLGAALVAGVGGKAVLEDDDVVVGLGDLGLGLPRARRAQRAVLGRGVIGAVLAPGRDGHPLFEQGIPAKLAQGFS